MSNIESEDDIGWSNNWVIIICLGERDERSGFVTSWQKGLEVSQNWQVYIAIKNSALTPVWLRDGQIPPPGVLSIPSLMLDEILNDPDFNKNMLTMAKRMEWCG